MEINLNIPSMDKQEVSKSTERMTIPKYRYLCDRLLRLKALEAFRYRQFRLLWYGQNFASIGQWMDEVTRGWLIYELTNSALQLGLVRGIQAIPYFLLSPLAGSAADRYSRKMQVVIAQVVNALVYAATALLILTGQIKPWHVYATAFLMAVVQVFQQPARSAMVSDIVPRKSLTNAIGHNAIVNNMARSIGPALAGVLIVLFGTGGTYLIQSVFYFLATYWTAQLSLPKRPSASLSDSPFHRESLGQSIIEGWKVSWRNEAVRVGIICVMLVSLVIAPFITLLPVFARDILRVGASGQGLLLTAMGIGALCSAVLIASAGDKLPRGLLMMGSVALYGFTIAIFSASTWFPLSLVAMAITGLCTVHSHALVQTVIQSYCTPEFRGRTLALFHSSRVATVIGSIFIGSLSSLVGVRWAVASMGATGALAMIIIYVAMPRARLIR
jgi:MFS family permease